MKREGEQYFILAERQKKREGRSNKRGGEREKRKKPLYSRSKTPEISSEGTQFFHIITISKK